jgi:hypothetical protein
MLAALDEPYALPAGALRRSPADTFVGCLRSCPRRSSYAISEERLGDLLEAAHGGDGGTLPGAGSCG